MALVSFHIFYIKYLFTILPSREHVSLLTQVENYPHVNQISFQKPFSQVINHCRNTLTNYILQGQLREVVKIVLRWE